MRFLSTPLPEEIRVLVSRGEFRRARERIDFYLSLDPPEPLRERLLYEKERMRRLRIDYPIPEERAKRILRDEIKGFREGEFREWLRHGHLDYILIDGRRRYFSRFVDNLIFSSPDLANRRVKRKDPRVKELLLSTIARMLAGERKRYRVRAAIKVRISKRYEGSKFRVYLPFPREGFQVEKVKLLNSHPGEPYISSEKQRTAYFETREREIRVEFEYIISEVIGGIEGEAKKEHLEKRLPHVSFTPYLREIAESIVSGEESDWDKARKIYEWVTSRMRYFYVRNYGTYENIAEYAASNFRGDCGFHAILFITLSRLAGIPAKWQSGWFVTPYCSGPHDWAQVYLDGKWYPVDASFGNLRRHTKVENEFYFGNLDAFRMIANDDLLGNFDPEKRFWRSDPVDNQVGEVENDEKNLYYDDFSWKIKLLEMKEI